MGNSIASLNPGVERDNLPSRKTKGSSYDYFDFPPNNRFHIPASDYVWGWQSKTFDCIGTKFKVDEFGKIELRRSRASENKDYEHSVARALSKGNFCSDKLELLGYDAYGNVRRFLVHVENNFIQMVIEDDAVIFTRPEPKPEVAWLKRIAKLFSFGG
ncbi:hypothetical protein D3C81_304840 [compost metagenome]